MGPDSPAPNRCILCEALRGRSAIRLYPLEALGIETCPLYQNQGSDLPRVHMPSGDTSVFYFPLPVPAFILVLVPAPMF